MAKTWFQHDMNASEKYGFSNLLIQKNGCDLYGKFWLLQEFFYSSQINSNKFKNTIRINESKMVSVLKTNRKRLGTILETFRNTLGILSEPIPEPFGTVYETTMPKALIFITKRKEKQPHIEVEVDKEVEVKVDKKNKRFIHPTLEEVKKYIKEKKYNIDPDKWWFFYDSKGWMVGKNKMKNWKSAIATWIPDSDRPKRRIPPKVAL